MKNRKERAAVTEWNRINRQASMHSVSLHPFDKINEINLNEIMWNIN